MESVSIIVPVFRQARYLRRAISSVLEQDYGSFEVVVVDDGSEDDSHAVALEMQSVDPRVRTVVRQANGGLGRARNTGLEAARGEYVGFLDSDDYLLPGAISSRVTALSNSQEPNVVGAYGDWIHVQEHVDGPVSIRPPRRGLPIVDAESYTGFNSFIVTSPLVDRAAAIEAGGFGMDLPMLEDWVLWLRMLARGGRFIPVEHVVCVYRQRPGSMLRSRGTTLPASANTMNTWWLDHGHHLSDGGRAQAWLEERPALGFHRRNWISASSEGLEFFKRERGRDVNAAAADGVVSAMTEALNQSGASVADSATAVNRAVRIGSLAQLTDSADRPSSFDWVLVPTDIEGALEAAVLANSMQRAGTAVAIGVVARQRLVAQWPAIGPNLPVVTLDDEACDAANFVVWSVEDTLVVRLARAHGRNRVFSRPTGIGVFHVMRRGGQLRFRAGARVLFRTPLEVAEYGDRPHAVVESGTTLGLARRESRPSCSVFVPDDFLSYPALDAWVSSALRAAASVRSDVRLIGSERVSRRLKELRVGAVDLALFHSDVVLPLTNAVSLVQGLGGRAVVFAPSVDHDIISSAWLSGLDLAQDEHDLVKALTDTDRLPAGAGTISPTSLGLSDWAALFESALVID